MTPTRAENWDSNEGEAILQPDDGTVAPDRVAAEFGRRMRRRRDLLGISHRELAERTGIKAGSLAAYERAHRAVRLEVIWRIAAGLDCSAADLLPLEEVRSPENALRDIEAGQRVIAEAITRLRMAYPRK